MAEKRERTSLQSPIGTATFVHLWEPYAIKQKDPNAKQRDPQYSVMLVFDPETSKSAAMKELKLACIAAAEAKFGNDARDKIKKGKINMPWRDATDYEEYGEPFTADGSLMIQFKSNTAPGIVDKRAKPVMKQSEVYSGCKMRVSFGVWAYDTNGNKGVTLLLNNVQKTGDGEKLAGRPDAEDEFDAVEDDDDDLGDDDDI